MNKIKRTLVLLSMVLIAQMGHSQCQYLDTLGIVKLQDSLSKYFPKICKKVVIGKSIHKKDIIALKFSDNVNIDEAEPEMLITACIHADEEDPQQVIMKFARTLCLEYNKNTQITNLINTREIWIIGVVNPDGLRGIGSGGSFTTRLNSNRVDLNRNFGYMWNAESTDPHENSEQETKVMRDFILSRNFNVMIDYHSGIQGIIYPWYYKKSNAPDFTEIAYLANQYDVVSGYPANVFAVTSGADLYITNGSMSEFAYGSLGVYAYAVELQNFSNRNWDDCQLLNLNKPAILMMAEKAGEGITGIISDKATGKPIQAKITVQGRVPLYSSQVNGDYHRFLKAGTYTVQAVANGYMPSSASLTVVDGAATTHNFQLTANNSYSAQKILVARNFGNSKDPGETWKALGTADGAYYAMGDTGYVVLDMGQAVKDMPGNDITIHGAASGAGDQYELFHSNSLDGPWTSLGTGNTTTSYDLSGVADARYFRVQDNGQGAGNVVGAGFHLDAITAVGLTVGITQAIEDDNNIVLYPNPTQGEINIKGDNLADIQNISVYNGLGILLSNSKFSTKLDISNYPAGSYFIAIHKKNTINTFKIIKK